MSYFDQLMRNFLEVSYKNKNGHLKLPPDDSFIWFMRRKMQLYYYKNEERCLLKPHILSPDSKYDSDGHRNFMKFYSFPNFLTRGNIEPDPCPNKKFIFHMLNVGFLFRSIFVSCVLYSFAQVIDVRQIEIRYGANRTQHCVLKSDIINSNRPIDQEYDLLKGLLKLNGYCMLESTSLFCYSLTCLVSLIFTLYVGAGLNRKQYLYLNALTFHRSPTEERKRIRKKLATIIQNLYKSADHVKHTCSETSSSGQWHRDQRQNSITCSINSAYMFHHRTLSFSSMNPVSRDSDLLSVRSSDIYTECNCAEESRDRLKFVHFIFRERLFNMVKPSNLTNQFHARLSRLQNLISYGFTIGVVIFISYIIYVWLSMEIKARIENRINYIKCLSWNANSTLIRNTFDLDRDPLLEREINIYRRYMNYHSWILTIRVILIEMKRIYNGRFLEFIAEHSTAYFIALFWMFDYIWYFSQGCYFIFEWIIQLERQLKICIHLLEELSINELENKINEKGEQKISEQKLMIEKALTITYLNFELFRQEYKSFRIVTNFLVNHLIPIALTNSLFSYMIIATYDNRVPLVFSINVAFILILNFFVTYCVSLIKRIQRIYKTITIIVIKSSQAQMELCQIVKLWRRQVLSDSEVMNSYCIQVLGGNFSQSTLIAVDSYVVAFWLAISR